MVLICLAEGFEEVEALTPLDLLRRGGVPVKTVGIGGKYVTGSHGICVCADLSEDEVNVREVEMLILPGGMPGTDHLDASAFIHRTIDAVLEKHAHVGAICAAPRILGKRGDLSGLRATCYPGFEKDLRGATVLSDSDVVTDANVTTARGMGSAFAFGKELLALCVGNDMAQKIATAAMEPKSHS